METLDLLDRLEADSDQYPVEACYLGTCAELTTTITHKPPMADSEE
jgi:hypothetical protein